MEERVRGGAEVDGEERTRRGEVEAEGETIGGQGRGVSQLVSQSVGRWVGGWSVG